MAGVSMIMPIFSAVGSIFSAVSQSGAASSAAQAQSNAMAYNAAVERNNAISAQQAAAANAQQEDKLGRARLEKMKANMLGSGYLMEGTPLLLVQDEAAQNELDKQKTLWKGQVDANTFNNQATLDDYNASVAKTAGENKSSSLLTSGLIGGASTIGSSLLRNN